MGKQIYLSDEEIKKLRDCVDHIASYSDDEEEKDLLEKIDNKLKNK